MRNSAYSLVILILLTTCTTSMVNAATYYVRKTGNNSNSGTTAAQAWLTIDRAANTVVAGDVVYVGAGTYNEEVTPNNDGTAGNLIRYVADTTGAFTGDAGTVLISSVTFQAFDIDTDDYLRITGFKMTGGTARALRINGSAGIIIEDCEIYSSSGDGIYPNDSTCTLDRCIVRNCTDFGLQLSGTSTVTVNDSEFRSNGIGVYSDGLGTRAMTMSRCQVLQNGGRGIYLDGGTYTLKNCLIRANVTDGVWLLNGSATLWHCTLYANQGVGVRQSAGTATITNSIIANGWQQGLLLSGGSMTHTYNCVYGNAWGNFSGVAQSTGEVITDPRFWSTTCLELQDGSPCINTGVNPGGAVTDDIEKVARPSGGAYDMGCYETVVVNYTSLVNAYSSLNPYAWWRLNEAAGATASDQMSVRHGTYQNGVGLDKLGVPIGDYNKAADFDGVNDKVGLGTVNPTVTAMSFVGWMKADTFNVTNSDILAKASGTLDANYYWSIGNVNSGGYQRLQFRFRAGGTTAVAIASTENLGTGAWVFVAGVYNGQTLIVYKDGFEVGRTTLTGTPDLSAATNAAIGDNPVGGRPFDGLLDEIAIFTKELKPRDIAAIYASTLKGSIAPGVVPKLWGIDEDDANLFAFTNYNNVGTLITYGRLKWRNGGVNTDLIADSNVSSLAITRHGRAYMTSDTSLGTTTAPVLLAFDLNDASTTLPNVVSIVGSIPTSIEIRGLAIDPTNEEVYALRSDGWLFVISPTNASIVRTVGLISGLGATVTVGEDMVFDPFGNLYVIDDADDQFYRVNKANGAILSLVPGGSLGTLQGMAWDAVNSRLLISETDSDFIMNIATNLSSVNYLVNLAAVGLTDIEALSFVPSEGRKGIWPKGVRVLKWKEVQ
jgi:parallel beta-helix repeat protein